jgi:selenide,water dikinase
MGAHALAQVLRPLATVFPPGSVPELLVGLEAPDDAAVYSLGGDRALVVTTDFFPPIVDDPYDFGAVAAANAMSDVFAMGGEVILALNIAGFPDVLPTDVGSEVIRGGAETVAAAGAVLAGGHTVTGPEPLYGLAVVGMVDPARILRKGGAKPGDVLVLTKPIGTGVVTTALKQGKVDPAHLEAAVDCMKELNKAAGRAASGLSAHAVTDVTGFGLVGHALELAEASEAAVRLDVSRIPLLPGAEEYAGVGCIPGGTVSNGHTFEPRTRGLPQVSKPWLDLLFDPQTSGGLLVALPPQDAREFQARLRGARHEAVVVGSVIEGAGVEIVT